jgi:hypothetical protein
MAVSATKSKKQSDASSRSPHEPLIFFTDANLGRHIVANALRHVGEQVRVCDEEFEPGTPDIVWLQRAGAEGWIVLTRDSRIRYRRNEKETLLAAGVRAFVLVSQNLPGPEMAEVFVKALPTIKRLCAKHVSPFIAHVQRGGYVELKHVTKIAFEKDPPHERD